MGNSSSKSKNLRKYKPDDRSLLHDDEALERVWSIFGDLCQIPRQSTKEEEVIDYVKDFAGSRDLELETDSAGNVIFLLPATKGKEDVPGIIFQGHLDMVSQGEPDPGENGVVPYIFEDDDGLVWVMADGTTLGADNGIGVSMALALADEDIPHGPLAFLLTNREEIGLVSVREMELKSDLSKYRFLVNVDSEVEGTATISCAGAGDTTITLKGKTTEVKDRELVEISLTGLMGGHSGVVIHENRLNAVKAIMKVVALLEEKTGSPINLVLLESGTARNAIPSSAKAVIAVDPEKVEEVTGVISEVRDEILEDSKHKEERGMVLSADISDAEAKEMFDETSTKELRGLLAELPDGLIKMSDEVDDYPETSTNIGIVGISTADSGSIKTMTRSCKPEELENVRAQIKSVAEQYGATVEQPPAYTGWAPVKDSKINEIVADAWGEVGKDPLEFRYSHGGLECGVLLGRYPHLEAISIGPQVHGAHTIEERVDVASVGRYYKLLKIIIKEVSSLV